VLTDRSKGGLKLKGQREQRGRRGSRLRCDLFRSLQFGQSRLPAFFQFGGDQAVLRVDLQELALSQGGFVPEASQALLMGMGHLRFLGLLCGDSLLLHIQFQRPERLEEGFDHLGIYRIRWNVLADRHTILLAQIVAEIAGTVFVLDDHLVSTLATGHHAL
jgi:hypothetical protein